MSLTEEQIENISKEILVSDIVKYIQSHSKEFENFIKEREMIKNEARRIKNDKPMG